MTELPPPPPPGQQPAPAPAPPQAPPAPTGFVPYPTPTTSVPNPDVGMPFVRVGGLAKGMLVLLAISAALQVVSLPVMIAMQGKASDFLEGRVSEDSFRDAFNTQSAIQGLQGGVIVAIVVLTMIWMFRLAQNHRRLGRPGSTWKPGWAIGGWFVPPGTVYAVPWLMFNELWRGSDPNNVPNDPDWKRRPLSPILAVWWVLYGLVPLLGLFIGLNLGFGDFGTVTVEDAAERIDDFFALQLGLAVVSVVTHGVYAKLVYDLTRRQRFLTGE